MKKTYLSDQNECRQALIDAVQVGDEERAKELLWQTVIAYQGCPDFRFPIQLSVGEMES